MLYDKKRNKTVYCIDIDGTITNETEGWDYQNRTPKQEMIDAINYLKGINVYIILWTARHSVDRTVTEEWLHKHGVQYDELIMDKMFFDMYICDKAKHVEDFLDGFSR